MQKIIECKVLQFNAKTRGYDTEDLSLNARDAQQRTYFTL